MKIWILLALAAVSARSLRPRDKFPAFKAKMVLDTHVSVLDSSTLAGNYFILIFYPLDFTFVCPTELVAFSDSHEEFVKLNTRVFGISTDSHFSHLAWLAQDRKQGGVGKLSFPLISDFSKQISRDFGFLVEDHDDELDGASLRGLAIIDGKGIVRHMQINDAPVGRSVDEVLRLVKAFKHTDEHGVVCPANWRPGSKTIIPEPEKKNEYFSSAN